MAGHQPGLSSTIWINPKSYSRRTFLVETRRLLSGAQFNAALTMISLGIPRIFLSQMRSDISAHTLVTLLPVSDFALSTRM
jgi:hypothetical protein